MAVVEWWGGEEVMAYELGFGVGVVGGRCFGGLKDIG